MKIQTTLAVLAVSGLAAAASGSTLWDQSALDWNANGFYNTISGSPPFGATAYAMADVHVTGGGWTINSVTMYFTCFDFSWATNMSGRFYLQSKTGPAPTVLPGGSLLAMTSQILNDPSVGQAYYAVTLSGLNVNVAAGDYWIGITPSAPAGPFGPERGLASSANYGASTWNYATGIGGGWNNTGVDAAILIQGTSIPAPSALGALGLVGVFASRRRRA